MAVLERSAPRLCRAQRHAAANQGHAGGLLRRPVGPEATGVEEMRVVFVLAGCGVSQGDGGCLKGMRLVAVDVVVFAQHGKVVCRCFPCEWGLGWAWLG